MFSVSESSMTFISDRYIYIHWHIGPISRKILTNDVVCYSIEVEQRNKRRVSHNGTKSLKEQYMTLTRSSPTKIVSGSPPWSLRPPLLSQLNASGMTGL